MILLGILISYLLGSMPTAYIFGKFYKGIDIREYGSGNVGATNVFRVLGKWPGMIVLLIDILKGLLPVIVVADFLGLESIGEWIILGLIAVIGHNWTVFLKFKGGKGIATGLGVLIALAIKIASVRPVFLGTMMVWVVTFLVSGFVSLASILAAVFLPIFMVFTHQPLEIVSLGIIFCIFVVLRHRSNIRRILLGQESRVSFPFFRKKHK